MEYCFDDVAPIKVHPQCVFIATANLGGQYTGTHKLDRALLDRFMIVEIDPLSSTEVRKAIHTHCPSIDTERLKKMVSVYTGINKAHNEFTVSFNLSIRHLKMIGELVEDGFTLYDAFYIICNDVNQHKNFITEALCFLSFFNFCYIVLRHISLSLDGISYYNDTRTTVLTIIS